MYTKFRRHRKSIFSFRERWSFQGLKTPSFMSTSKPNLSEKKTSAAQTFSYEARSKTQPCLDRSHLVLDEK